MCKPVFVSSLEKGIFAEQSCRTDPQASEYLYGIDLVVPAPGFMRGKRKRTYLDYMRMVCRCPSTPITSQNIASRFQYVNSKSKPKTKKVLEMLAGSEEAA